MSGQNGNGKRSGLSAEDIAARLSMQYRVPTINLAAYEIERAVLDLVPEALCRAHTVIPVSRAGASLIVAMVDPTDAASLAALKAQTGLTIEPVIAIEVAILVAIAKYYAAQ